MRYPSKILGQVFLFVSKTGKYSFLVHDCFLAYGRMNIRDSKGT